MFTDLLTAYPQLLSWFLIIAAGLMIVWFAVAIYSISVLLEHLIANPSAARAEFELELLRARDRAIAAANPDGIPASLPTAPGGMPDVARSPETPPRGTQDGLGSTLPTAKACRPCARIRALLGLQAGYVERVTTAKDPGNSRRN